MFYNSFAKDKGFSVRKNNARRNPVTTQVFQRQFTCSRQGYMRDIYVGNSNRSREPRALTRCSSTAQFEVKHDKEKGDWFVLRYVRKHSHPLAKADEVHFLRLHRKISNAVKANVMDLKEVGLRQHLVMDVMERQHGGFESTGFVSRGLYNC
jgi:FAR1 DNA-binding domain.